MACETQFFEHVREEEEVEEERSSSVLPEATEWSVGNEEQSMATLMPPHGSMCEAMYKPGKRKPLNIHIKCRFTFGLQGTALRTCPPLPSSTLCTVEFCRRTCPFFREVQC